MAVINTCSIGALIPIRLASERLPGKALKDLNGRPVVYQLLDRAFASRYLVPENVIVCTTENSEDDALVEAVLRTGARCFRGSENDIIDRFKQAADTFGFDAFIQIDGDDPCTDPGYMDLCMQELLSDPNLGIVYCEGLPLGLASKAIRTSALQKVWESHLTSENDTGFIYYFTKTDLCMKKSLGPIKPSHVNNQVRLTLDYEEDLIFFRELFKHLYRKGEVFSIDEIVALLAENPELMMINSALSERYWERTKEKTFLEYKSSEGTSKKI